MAAVESRRDFMLGAGAACAAALLRAPAATAAGRKPMQGLIDVHHHIRPPNAAPAFARLTANWSPQAALAEMDGAGVATGMAFPGPVLAPDLAARPGIARSFNEFAADLARAHPGRFGLFASLPFPAVDATLAEIDYATKHLAADGFGVTTSYGDLWLGDAKLWPIYERLNALDAVVFVHPADAACCAPTTMSYLQPDMDGSWIDWPMNTARAIFSLLATGATRRYPRIRWIFAHGGGVMPLLVKRIANFDQWANVGPGRLKQLFPDGIEAEFARLHFECAQCWLPPNVETLRRLVPDSQLLFGSDYPFFSLDSAARGLAGLRLAPGAASAIGSGNARRLLPRWA